MGWFSRSKPRDLIADSNAEWEAQRDAEQIEHDVLTNQLLNVMAANTRGSHDAQAIPLIAAGGWCAPSVPSFLDLPEIQIRRGGVKWPTS